MILYDYYDFMIFIMKKCAIGNNIINYNFINDISKPELIHSILVISKSVVDAIAYPELGSL